MKVNKIEIRMVKEKLANGDNPIDVIEDIFINRTALVVSAGPSAEKWYEVYEGLKADNPIIVCVKQTLELNELAELCDIHFINPYNLKKYNYISEPLIVFSDEKGAPKVFSQYDIKFEVTKNRLDGLETTLAHKRNFDDFLLSTSDVIRPWGPGIMYESVFYTLLLMGVNKIVTVGWDIADSQGANSHFYDKNRLIQKIDIFLRRLLTRLRLIGVYNRIMFLLGRKYNHASMLEGEAKIIADSVGPLKQWLNTKGVNIEIVSGSNWMNK